MNGSNPGTRKHRDDQFGGHRHIDRNYISLLHTKLCKPGGCPAHLSLKFTEGEGSPFTGWFTNPDHGCLVAEPGCNMLIDAGGRGIGLPTGKPLGMRRIPPQHLVIRLQPWQRGGPFTPEGNWVIGSSSVELLVSLHRTDSRLFRKGCRGRKGTSLLHDTRHASGWFVRCRHLNYSLRFRFAIPWWHSSPDARQANQPRSPKQIPSPRAARMAAPPGFTRDSV